LNPDSLKANIGNFTPSKFGLQLDWKDIREKGGAPLALFVRFRAVREITRKSDDSTATVFEGQAELDTTQLNDARVTQLEQITGLRRDAPTAVSFFSIGSMFISQLEKNYGVDWSKDCVGRLAHIAYGGKLPNPKKKGTEYHSVFVTDVPETVQTRDIV